MWNVSVGVHIRIGAVAVVSNNVSVCADCMIGAGAVGGKDVVEDWTYVGVSIDAENSIFNDDY